MAGVWERKVGAIKNILNVSMGLLGKRHLSREELHTLLQEAAAVINNTPLAEVSMDPNDPFPVTPAHLLTLRGNDPMPTPPSNEGDILAYGKKRWRRVNLLADQFWKRWRRDYIQALTVRRKWLRPTKNVAVGDVVVIKQDTARNSWPMGIVVDTKPNSDGLVRSATIRLKPTEAGTTRTMERAVHDLVVVTAANEDTQGVYHK